MVVNAANMMGCAFVSAKKKIGLKFAKIFCALVVCTFLVLPGYAVGNAFKLESQMLAYIDGKSFGVDGEAFGLILQNRREIRKRLYGASTKSGERIGMFDFEGKKYCLVELAQIEADNEASYFHQKSSLETNKSKYSVSEWALENATIENEYNKKKTALREILEFSKNDFISITVDYVESLNGIKEPVLVLLEEFCAKRGVERCFLLKWGETEAGKEEGVVRSELVTFKEFVQFNIDLSDFLEVMARSCPKGQALFLEMVKKAKQNKEEK